MTTLDTIMFGLRLIIEIGGIVFIPFGLLFWSEGDYEKTTLCFVVAILLRQA